MTAPTSLPLWHGYTLADLDHLARAAARSAFGGRILDPTDRYQTAWSAIAEHLCTADEPPTRPDLITNASNAVSRAGQDHRRTWGMARTWGAAEGSVPAYTRYWELARRAAGSPEDAVVDRTALHQIWPRLSLTHRVVLMAMAIHGDQVAAADAVGKNYGTFGSHLKSARREFFALWHEHETPSRLWGKADRRHGRRTATQVLVNRRQQRTRRAKAAV